MLNRIKDRANETYLISAPLAARLGLERLWSVDDHSADTPDPTDPIEKKAYADAIMGAWNNPASQTRRTQDAELGAALDQPTACCACTASIMRRRRRPDLSVRLRRHPGRAVAAGFGRRYLGYWETRNLRMVANMRDVLGRYPGTRMLTIVGASHKGYYEAYLDQMHDVQLVDPEPVLR